MARSKQVPDRPLRAAPEPTFRSSAVARLAGMPVATLRIWEQRYQAVQPASAPSGHRLYSPADVQRVLVLRQLTEQGHAIGSIAALDGVGLQQVADTQAGRGAAAVRSPARRGPALRLVVVGQPLAARLQRPALAAAGTPPLQVVAVFDTLAQAARAAGSGRADVLVWQAPAMQPGLPPDFVAARDAWRARQTVVLYRFAGAAAREALARTGALVLREPADDASLGEVLARLHAAGAMGATGATGATGAGKQPAQRGRNRSSGQRADGAAPRRFDDATLTAIAGLTPTVACECPRHVAELLMQLSSFETYSAACADRSPADAQLHAHLQRVAGAARMLFESALETVARHEGLSLP